jgi:hypothetical protein
MQNHSQTKTNTMKQKIIFLCTTIVLITFTIINAKSDEEQQARKPIATETKEVQPQQDIAMRDIN